MARARVDRPVAQFLHQFGADGHVEEACAESLGYGCGGDLHLGGHVQIEGVAKVEAVGRADIDVAKTAAAGVGCAGLVLDVAGRCPAPTTAPGIPGRVADATTDHALPMARRQPRKRAGIAGVSISERGG